METRDILTPEESEALRTSDAAARAAGPRPDGEIVDLHADHWERIARDRVPALDSVMERMGSLLKLSMRKFFRQPVEVVPQPLRDERWGSYVRRMATPTSLNVLLIQPLNLRGVVCLDAAFVFALVDIFFGGDGKAQRPDEHNEFTQMEVRLTRKFIETVLDDMREGWRPFIKLDLSLGNSEVNPIFAAVAASSDTIVVNTFVLTLAGGEFRFDIVLPTALVEPIRQLPGAGASDKTQGDSDRWERQLQTEVQDAQVSLRAVLGHTEIILRDLVQARPGDIIPFDAPSLVTLLAGDTPLLEGSFGACQGRNAVRITKPANRAALGEKYGKLESH
jgi:flagellar motor switch protein FliM